MTVLDILNFRSISIYKNIGYITFDFEQLNIKYKLLKNLSKYSITKYGIYRKLIYIDNRCPVYRDIHFLEDKL